MPAVRKMVVMEVEGRSYSHEVWLPLMEEVDTQRCLDVLPSVRKVGTWKECYCETESMMWKLSVVAEVVEEEVDKVEEYGK